MVRLHWPAELRSAFDALFAIDDALAEVVQTTSQPALGAIKLAWWREALERLDGARPPAEPRLQAAAAELLNRGVSGAELARLEDGWAALLEQQVDHARASQRGVLLFGLAARLLCAGSPDPGFGSLWAGVDAARRMKGRLPAPTGLPRAARGLRPITMLAALALRDAKRGFPIEDEATPARSWTILRHRLTGR